MEGWIINYMTQRSTIETLIEAPPAGQFFCAGNLEETAINNLFIAHKCNMFFFELKMGETESGESG